MIFDMTKRKGGAPTPTNPVAEDNDVIFIDYDGTIRYSYTKAEFAQLSELPPNPDHTDMGLVAEGWNWSLANAKSYVSKYRWLVIGQTYHTASGAMEIDVELRSGRMNPTVGLCVVGTVNIEWGDGTEDTVLTGTSITTAVYASHEYADSGKYTIRIKNSEGVRSFYRITGHSSNGSLLFCKSSASSINSTMVYH